MPRVLPLAAWGSLVRREYPEPYHQAHDFAQPERPGKPGPRAPSHRRLAARICPESLPQGPVLGPQAQWSSQDTPIAVNITGLTWPTNPQVLAPEAPQPSPGRQALICQFRLSWADEPRGCLIF